MKVEEIKQLLNDEYLIKRKISKNVLKLAERQGVGEDGLVSRQQMHNRSRFANQMGSMGVNFYNNYNQAVGSGTDGQSNPAQATSATKGTHRLLLIYNIYAQGVIDGVHGEEKEKCEELAEKGRNLIEEFGLICSQAEQLRVEKKENYFPLDEVNKNISKSLVQARKQLVDLRERRHAERVQGRTAPAPEQNPEQRPKMM